MPDEPVPCQKNAALMKMVDAFAQTLRDEAHTLGNHGLSKAELHQSGLFRGAIERVRGQFAASMGEKRTFVKCILDHMADGNFIRDWKSTGEDNRHDYEVTLNDGTLAAIELKGCLDGNNTNIFVRPDHVQEFILWSVCNNTAGDPRHNVWSGIHTRLSAEIIHESKPVDGLVVWDWACGSIGRPCPKVSTPAQHITVGPYSLPPPCIYLFPKTIPRPGRNANPPPQAIGDVKLLAAFHRAFQGKNEHLNSVFWSVEASGQRTARKTTIKRGGGVVVKESRMNVIKR